MDHAAPPSLFRKIDCLQIPALDLEASLAFYRDCLGHTLNWLTATAADLRLHTPPEGGQAARQDAPEGNSLSIVRPTDWARNAS
jgi:catechol 2,3-dioxygenase-like lactoylglutathione lyase family enzyme